MLDGMANVEQGRGFEFVGFDVAARATGIAAIVVAVTEGLGWVGQFSIVEPVIAVIGAEGFFWIFRILWIIELVATAVAAAGLIVGWRCSRPLWARGVGLVAAGLLLNWGWWALDRYVDLWGYRQIVTTGDEPNPELVRISLIELGVSVAVSVAVIVLLLWGGRRLLAAAHSAE